MSEPTGGTWTFTVGDGVSDPVPYNADAGKAWDAFYQACDRNTLLPNSGRYWEDNITILGEGKPNDDDDELGGFGPW